MVIIKLLSGVFVAGLQEQTVGLIVECWLRIASYGKGKIMFMLNYNTGAEGTKQNDYYFIFFFIGLPFGISGR